MSRTLHIVVVNRWYPPYTGFGGVAAYDTYLGQALARLGHRVTILAARWTKDMPEVQQDGPVHVLRILAPEWSRLKRLPLLGRYVRPLQQFLYSRDVARALQQIPGVDVVEFAEVNAEGLHYLRLPRRAPVVVRCHTPNFVLRRYYTPAEMPFDTSWTARMEFETIRRADAISAPSQDMANVIAGDLALPPAAITVIPNALDISTFASAVRTPALDGTVTILHVGRLERVKGIETLARAFALLAPQAPHARLVFVGDDRPDAQGSTWRTRLQKEFQAQGLGERVHFTGGVDQSELIRWYQRADLAVVPSMLYESFSYTCAQAMAAGLPVVATRIGGIPETVGNSGKIVSSGSVEELSQALLELVHDGDLRVSLGRAARQRALETFDAVLVAQTTLNLYESLLPGK